MNSCKLPLAALAAALSVACSDIVEPFYAQSYEIGRVSATAVLETLPAEEGDEADPADLDRLKAEIEADVLAAAPVAAGGGYRLEYVEAFAGPLTVYPAPDVPALSGTFAESTTGPVSPANTGRGIPRCGSSPWSARSIRSARRTDGARRAVPAGGLRGTTPARTGAAR